MRDAVFFLAFLPMPIASFLYPWCGLLLWCWIAFVSPQRELWGFAAGIPYNQLIAIATLLGWVLSRERKAIRIDTTTILLFLLALLLGISTAASLAPDVSREMFQRHMKSWVLLFLVPIFLTSRVRVHAFVWLMAFCIGYYGVKSGGLFLLSAGRHHFTGPPGSQISDNNHIALAMVTSIPLMNYLRLQSERWWIRLGLAAAMVLTALGVVGTYSRGGFIALGVMAAMLWWKSRGKLMLVVIVGLAAVAVAHLASDQWRQRIETVETAHEDDRSFKGRVLSWQVHLAAGSHRPLVGAGLMALQEPEVYVRYLPERPWVDYFSPDAKAAHSIYFQMLGEVGIVALALYLVLLATAWHNASWVKRRSAASAELAWMGDLARMGQVSIVAFVVGGAGISMAFYDYFLVLLVLMATLRRLLKEEESALVPTSPRDAGLRSQPWGASA